MPAVWSGDGLVTAYDAASASLLLGAGHLVSPQTSKDAQLITRMQYNLPLVAGVTADQMKVQATFTYSGSIPNPSATETSSYGVTMWVVPASAFADGVTPTVQEIFASPSAVPYQSIERFHVEGGGTVNNGTKTFNISGPRSADLTPGAKYWLLVVPTWLYTWRIVIVPPRDPHGTPHNLQVPNIPIGQPFGATIDTGRAVSFWTNRSPSKPVITAPATGSVATAGSNIPLTWAQPDPDAVAGTVDTAHTDIGGAAIQYRARPTAANPSPPWKYLLIRTSTAHSNSWYIKGSGWIDMCLLATTSLIDGALDITAGADEAGAVGKAYLPSGDWQIRVQTYDQGNPSPNTANPISVATSGPGTNSGYRPETFPAFNVSPWSDIITIFIPTQVPPPVPVSPVQAALVVGRPVTLIWAYKNTALPPNAQKTRTIQMREVGAAAWTTVLNADVSASSSWLVTGFTMEVGKQYEWRVMVTDSTNFASQFSASARFYVIPAPISGDVRPDPTDTIDGATLGCGRHRAFIYRRGGTVRVGEVTGLSYVDWARVRDDISTAKIVVNNWDIDCGNLLAQLQCWAYELVIFRNNGFHNDRVWEGPITLLTYTETDVTIEAKDVMGYAYRRIIREAFNDTANGDTVVSRGTRILQSAFAPDDPNVLANLIPLSLDDDAREYRSTPPYSRTAFEEVDDMAANAGLDYTVIGRAIVLWGTKHRIGTLPEFKDSDLGAAPIVSEYGMSMANHYAIGDGNGVYGSAVRGGILLNGDGTIAGSDPVYGLVEMLSSSWASDSAGDTGTYTQEGLQTIIQSFSDFAEVSIGDRYPPPVVVRIPDNTSLNPGLVVSIQQLVPGVVIPLRSMGTLRHVVGSQKLDSVKVVDQGSNEVVSITVSPFNRDDVVPEGAGG